MTSPAGVRRHGRPHRAPVRRYLLTSHDGFGLGHVRRNARIAAAIRALDPTARIVLVTGVRSSHAWLGTDGVEVVRVPALSKDASGSYVAVTGSVRATLATRRRRLLEVVEELRPNVVLVDRHPFGVRGELRPALALARRHGAAVVLGLRDVLDDPAVVRAELAGPDWADAGATLDSVLVYGTPAICDHVREYGLPTDPRYCGVVTSPLAAPRPITAADAGTLLLTMGGGADGGEVLTVTEALPHLDRYDRVVLVAGPAARLPGAVRQEVEVVAPREDCSSLYAAAAASVQMGGYNSTYEAIAAGLRPLLVPRRAPRREQAIRAGRLACLGLADVLDPGAGPAEIGWLLDRPRFQTGWDLARSGLDIEGAARAAAHLHDLAGAPVLTSPGWSA